MSNIIIQYLQWHFVEQPKAILRAWYNFLKFCLNYFSLPLLIKTLFSPWRKYKSSKGRRFDLKVYLNAVAFNAISRGIGAIMRSILIIIGITAEIFIFFAGIIIFVGWLILPALLVIGFFYGIKLLF